MADPRTVTIGDGKTYATLALAISGESYKDPTTDNGNGGPGLLYYDLYNLAGGAAETGTINVAGYGGDATNHLVIRNAASQLTASNRGKYTTDRWRLEPGTNLDGIVITSPYVHLEDVNVYCSASSLPGAIHGVYGGTGATNLTLERCILRCQTPGGNTQPYRGFYAASGTGTHNIINSLFWGWWRNGESQGYGIYSAQTGVTIRVWNCTFHTNYRAWWLNSGTLNLWNCGSYEGEAQSHSNAYNCVYEHTGGNPPAFVDSDNGDFHLLASDTRWKGQGDPHAGPGSPYPDDVLSVDVDNEARTGSTWDVGFDQVSISRNPVPMGFILG